MTIYEKSGTSLRAERIRGVWHELALRERGIARESETFFETESRDVSGQQPDFESNPESNRDRAALAEARSAIDLFPCEVMHSVVTLGRATHRYEERAWETSEQFAHLTIRCGRLHAAVHVTLSQLPIIPKAQRSERGVSLSPHATAQFTRELFRRSFPIPFRQIPRPGEVDGYGNPLEPALSPGGEPPNFFRPSYRYLPFRHPLGLALDLPEADIPPPGLELLSISTLSIRGGKAYIEGIATGPKDGFREIVIEADADALRSMTPGPPAEWFPLEGGTWGSRLSIDAEVHEI